MKYSPPTDRDRLDAVLRFVADARARTRPAAEIEIAAEEATRAGRYARYLARGFYLTTLEQGFRLSHSLAARVGRDVTQITDSALFENFLQDCFLGSLDAARRVGDFAVSYLGEIPNAPAWFRDLLIYERATFLQLATTDPGPKTYVPRRGHSAVCIQFGWQMAELVKRVKEGASVADQLKGNSTLLFARSPEGKLVVAEVDAATAAIFRAVNGLRNTEKIAEAADSIPEVANAYLDAMAKIGAVALP